jgi:uncharacterized protein (TIGR02058 family)
VALAVSAGSAPNSKGMTHVALVELGSGCCHYDDSTKAAIRACNDAIEWNSVKVRTIIPGSYDAMRLHVHLGVPDPDSLDLDAISACFPYGTLLPIEVDVGGLRGSSRAGLVADEPPEAHMTVAVACVTVGWGEPTDSEPGEAAQQQEDAASTSDATPSAPSASSASSQSFSPSGSADQIAKLAVAPTVAEMTPGSPELLARCAGGAAAPRHAHRLSPRCVTPPRSVTPSHVCCRCIPLPEERPHVCVTDARCWLMVRVCSARLLQRRRLEGALVRPRSYAVRGLQAPRR